jgi:flagellin
MRINNNMMAMNTHRQLGLANAGGAKSMEKLSSGFRINRAGDDAAGLSISEKMRGQIRGLTQASRNAQDGISLIQTAEGALTESHAILQRMRELAVQSANDTNVAVDRGALQAEIDQLAQELTRISTDTEFNTQKLLDGEFNDRVFHIGANEGQNIKLSIGATDAETLKVQGFKGEEIDLDGVTGVKVSNKTNQEIEIKYTDLGDQDAGEVKNTTAKVSDDGKTITITLAQAKGDGTDAGAVKATHQDIINALKSTGLVDVAIEDTADLTTKVTTLPTAQEKVTAGVTDSTVGINISNQKSADGAITTINTALDTVSAERSKLGAYQNRLEHTIKNLDNVAENLQAAESRIRDVDMAKEMMEMTRQNILQQASTAMLAQANQAPQTVLQLLR